MLAFMFCYVSVYVLLDKPESFEMEAQRLFINGVFI